MLVSEGSSKVEGIKGSCGHEFFPWYKNGKSKQSQEKLLLAPSAAQAAWEA